MSIASNARRVLIAAAILAVAGLAQAQDIVKLGMVAEFSGPFADYGGQMHGGMKAYMKHHGDTVAGKKIEIIQRDTTGPAPEVAKRLAQELVTRDNVDFLVGFGLTPNAMAAAPVATEAKKPMIIMNAATSIITTKSPYIARVSMTLPQVTQPMATGPRRTGSRRSTRWLPTTARGSTPRRRSPRRSRRWRRDRRQRAHAAAEPGFRAVHPARQGRQARSRIPVPAGGRAGHRVHESLRGARPRGSRHQADRHRRHHRRRRARGDGRSGARADHELPLLGRA